VVSNFIVQALMGQDITIYGSGLQTRSFCHVSDLIDAMVRMMNNEAGFVGPVNIGNPGEFTMLELAQTVIRLTGSASRIVYQPLPDDDPRQRQPDITQASEILKWKPSVGLDEGLRDTISFFRGLLEL
jgi:UDP-glucuronate decarboxylase